MGKVEIIKDDASIKNEMVPAGIRLGSDSDVIHKEEISDPWYQISSKDAFVIAAVVVAVVILVTVSSMALLFYMRGNENKLKKMLDFDNQINTNGSYKDLCQQRFDAKSSERLLGTNGDTVKDIKRESVRSARHPSSVSSWSEEPITSTLDIFSGHAILSYMEDHLQNTTRLDTEWNALCQYQADGVTYDAAMENIRKNRSSSLPFDHNRVKLHRDNNEGEESDYINASFIIDNDPTQPVYIACQGPLPSTVNDFWQMIWQQKCAAIVMLTPIIECGEVQCARYWPDEGSSQYGKYEIHLVSEHIWCEDYLVRSLYMKNVESGETRTLTQFHFLAFPHDSIPSSPIPLLEMRRKVSKCYRGTNTPIVVHCNDGVGRTGTYMLIDMVLNRIVKGKSREIDVAATLEHLRDQRANVVENKNQLQFALAAVAEEVNAMLKLNKAGN